MYAKNWPHVRDLYMRTHPLQQEPVQCQSLLDSAQQAQGNLAEQGVHIDAIGNAIAPESKAPRLDLSALPQQGVQDIQRHAVKALHEHQYETLSTLIHEDEKASARLLSAADRTAAP